MASKPKKTAEQQQYAGLVKKFEPKPRYWRNAALAFLFGGMVSILGQFLIDFYRAVLKLKPEEASNPAVATVILIAAILTGLGVFDKISPYAGAGLAVPVTGFANSMVSAALEFKREGLVLGVGSKMFSLAGSVITFGVVTAFFVGLIYALLVY